MKYLANLNKNHLVSFLVLTIGSLILGTEDRSNISNHYYITDRAFTIKQGGIIHVEYGLKQNDSYLSGGLEPVTVEFGGYDTKDAINFGNLPLVSQTYLQRTYSAWVYALAPGADPGSYIIMSTYAGVGSGGFRMYFKHTDLKLGLQVVGLSDYGQWTTPANLTLNAWYHVVITRDSTSPSSKPVMYINASPQTVTEEVTQTTATFSEIGTNLIVGNSKTVSVDWTNPFKGKIFDPRIYNRILTAAEVTTLYNAGVPDETLVTDGLVFQGLSTYTDRPLSAGHVLTSTDRLVENIIRAVGVPNGSPTIRANP